MTRTILVIAAAINLFSVILAIGVILAGTADTATFVFLPINATFAWACWEFSQSKVLR